MNKTDRAFLSLNLIDLARCILDVSERLTHPFTWEVECRRNLQNTARQLIAMAKAL
jgi:hypothetical protein